MGGTNPSAGGVIWEAKTHVGPVAKPVSCPPASPSLPLTGTAPNPRPVPCCTVTLSPGVTMHLGVGRASPRQLRSWGGRLGEPASARSRGAAALLLWVGSRQRARLLPKRVNHRSHLPLLLTISLADARKRHLSSSPEESTLLPGEGCLVLMSRWGRNFAVPMHH